MNFPYRYVVLTGATGGLGHALSQALAAFGAKLVLLDRDEGALASLRSELPPEAVAGTYCADFLNLPGLEGVLRKVSTEHPKIDLVIANAGIDRPFELTTFNWRSVVDHVTINTLANVVVLTGLLPILLKNPGSRFVSVASLAALYGFPFESAYCTSKAALVRFMESAEIELGPQGIGFTSVFPGYLDTPMVKGNAFNVKSTLGPTKAARKILLAVARGRRNLYFPCTTYLSIRFLGLLPRWLAHRIVRGQVMKSQAERSRLPSALLLLSLSITGLLTSPVRAQASVSGEVITIQGGKPVSGAMVTWTDEKGLVSQTVYSDARGRFNLPTGTTGNLRVRRTGYEDARLLSIPAGKPAVFRLHPMRDPKAISDALTASAHLAPVLKALEPELQTELAAQCLMCHQMGNALTRAPKSVEAWDVTIDRMEGMAALLSRKGKKIFPKVFHEQFNGSPLLGALASSREPDAELLVKSQVREWALAGPTSHIHDIVVSRSGVIYGVDMSTDKIYRINPADDSIQSWDFPSSDLPLGGAFEGAFHPFGTFQAKFGPHSVQEDENGVLWMTCSLAGEIVSFDPKTAKFDRYPVSGVYPHTMRFDRKGNLWFTIAVSNQVARLNTKTREMRVIDLPTDTTVQWISAHFARGALRVASLFPQKNMQLKFSMHRWYGGGHRILPTPYGIDINPKDGSVWYSKLGAGYIGRIDPETLAVEEFRTPMEGPRRLRFSRDGLLWIPAYAEGGLIAFDPSTRKFTTYPIPSLGPEQRETPYALNVHPDTQDVWITGGTSDRMIRFNPKTRQFSGYPLPTRVTFMREVEFTRDGQVCSSYANLPAYAIEGAQPKVFCLRP